MRYIPLIVLLLASESLAQTSGRVVGDSASKTYLAFDCIEARLIPMRSTVNFSDAAAAEKAGYTKGDKCSTTASRGVDYDTGSGPASIKTQELRRKSASLELIQDEISKWGNKTVRVIGDLSISDTYLGEFGRMDNKYYAFRLSSTTGGFGYFYMAKNTTSEGIRERIADPDVLYADCQVRILGVAKTSQYSSYYLGGDLLNCRFWTRDDDEN